MGEFDLNIDPQEEELIVDIDTDELSAEAINVATSLVSNLSTIYFDEEFMNNHPKLKKRIDIDLESLRILTKMKKTNEKVHDTLIKSISSTPNNASLYRALTQIQSTILDIQKQTDATIASLNNTLKGYQMEMQFDDEPKSGEGEESEPKNIYRGSKSFIQDMQKNLEESN